MGIELFKFLTYFGYKSFILCIVCKYFLPFYQLLLISLFPLLYICLQCWRPEFNPWVGKISWRRQWQTTSVFLPGKSHGHRSRVGYSPWGGKESDMTERIHFHFHRSFLACYNLTCLFFSFFLLMFLVSYPKYYFQCQCQEYFSSFF